MIVTGIISAINRSSGSFANNKYQVQIDYFKSPGDTDTSHYLFDANCSTIGGLEADYAPGDKVYIDFLQDQLSIPIIIGKIYRGAGSAEEARGYLHLNDLKVEKSVVLPSDIKIGNITYEDLKFLVGANKNFVNEEILIGQDKQILSSGVVITKAGGEWVADDKHIPTIAALREHGGGGAYNAGNGIKIEDNTISVKTDDKTLDFNNETGALQVKDLREFHTGDALNTELTLDLEDGHIYYIEKYVKININAPSGIRNLNNHIFITTPNYGTPSIHFPASLMGKYRGSDLSTFGRSQNWEFSVDIAGGMIGLWKDE